MRSRPRFNYQAIGETDRQPLRSAVEEIRRLENGMSTAAVEIGRRLQAVKSIMHDRKQWAAWVRLELCWNIDRAARYIRVAAAFGDVPHVDRFTFSAMLELAKEGTPAEAIAEALELAAAGEFVSHATVMQLIESKAPPARPRPRAANAKDQGERLERFVQSLAKRWPQQRRQDLVALLLRLAEQLGAETMAGPEPPADSRQLVAAS